MVSWAKRLDSVVSGCWNVEILEEQGTMVEVDRIPLFTGMSWTVSWELECILEGEHCGNFTAAPETKGLTWMNYSSFPDNI